MKTITCSAPAKLNLALDILGRRPDGYHDLRMVMQTVSLCDKVAVRETAAGFCLEAEGIVLPAGRITMEQRAAEAFFAALSRPAPGLSVHLEKHIPAYAGMGGGSADVAALLRGLRALYAPELPEEELRRIGAAVGSDVPFCVGGGTALAEGRGEALTSLPPLPECRVLICKPDFDLPTPALFGRVRVDALRRRPDLPAMLRALERGDLEGAAKEMRNVFEEVLTAEEARDVRYIKEAMLRCGALNAAMTGSGPTVFGLFQREAQVNCAEEVLRGRYSKIFQARPV